MARSSETLYKQTINLLYNFYITNGSIVYFNVEHFILFFYIAMRDLMLSSPNYNEVIRHVCNVRIVHVWKT